MFWAEPCADCDPNATADYQLLELLCRQQPAHHPTCWYCYGATLRNSQKQRSIPQREWSNGVCTSHIYIYIWHSNTTSTREKIFSTLSFHPPSLLMKLTKYPKSTSLSSNTSVWKCATRPYPFQATQINISFTSILMLQKICVKKVAATAFNQVARLMVHAPMSTKLPNFTVRQGIRPVVLRRNRSTRRRSCEVRGVCSHKLVSRWKCWNVAPKRLKKYSSRFLTELNLISSQSHISLSTVNLLYISHANSYLWKLGQD